MTLGGLPDHQGGQQLSIECSWASVDALGAKLALLLPFVTSLENGDNYLDKSLLF